MARREGRRALTVRRSASSLVNRVEYLPDRYADPDLAAIRDELLRKVTLVRAVKLAPFAARRLAELPLRPAVPDAGPPGIMIAPRQVVALGSSTVGPSALMKTFSRACPRTPNSRW